MSIPSWRRWRCTSGRAYRRRGGITRRLTTTTLSGIHGGPIGGLFIPTGGDPMEAEARFSLFATPCEADFTWLAPLNRELSRSCDSFPFEPHVTTYSGRYQEPERLKEAACRAVAGVAPFSLVISGIGCSMEYFKSLYIALGESPVLRGIHDRLKEGLGEDSGYRLFPHLSLLYADIPLAEKESLARSISLERGEKLFDRVKVVTPRNL